MSLLSAYNQKKKTVPELLSLLQDGDYILSAQALAEPVTLLEQFPLLHQWGRQNLVFNSCMPTRDLAWYHDPAMRETLEHVCWFFSPPARKAHQEGLCSFLPGYSTNLVRKTFQQLHSQGRRPVLLATASPMEIFLFPSAPCSREKSSITGPWSCWKSVPSIPGPMEIPSCPCPP